MSKHTPLPWKRGTTFPASLWYGGDDPAEMNRGRVADCSSAFRSDAENEANAALILHRVSTWDNMLAALKEVMAQSGDIGGGPVPRPPRKAPSRDTIRKVRAAIAEAERE